MKKLLAILIVAAVTSMASAVVSGGPMLSVNGATDIEEITLAPSDTFILDIHLDPTGPIGGTMGIVLSNAQGAMDYADMVINPKYVSTYLPDFGFIMETPWDFAWKVLAGTDPTPQEIIFDGGNFSAPNVGPTWLVDGIVFHCTEPTDVIIDLVVMGAGLDMGANGIVQPGTILDRIVVHQIPEPMTVALLGLGGLFLRRKK
jgi:hypothetical protein